MSDLDVKIVQLESMRVAVAHGFGTSPESVAWDKILAFGRSKGLLDNPEGVRFFGFNNPSPTPGSPNYGYEQWMTVGTDVEAEGEIIIKELPSRRYAVTQFKGLENIGRVWQELVTWFEDSPHKKPPYWHECLEELLTRPGLPPEESVFNLYLPIAE